MEYIRNTTDIQIQEPTAVSLGKFDGLHVGHRLLTDCVLEKKRDGLKAVMFTFSIPPKALVGREAPKVLTTNEEKRRIFERTGIDYLVEYPFTDEVRNMEPEAFIRMLAECFSVKCIVAGTDFRFGHDRSGNYHTLLEYGPKYGYETIVAEKKQYNGRDISSTYIREEILKGCMETANMLLGYEFFVQGRVAHGKKLGRTLGFPTVNLLPSKEKLLPPFGVYAVRVRIDEVYYDGVANVGVKPTIEGVNPTGVETYIFDFTDDIYEKEIEVQFLSFLRREQRFSSVDALKAQMAEDIKCAKAKLSGYKRRER